MIVLNMTLIFQVVHFLIAYFLLRTFLWKPVISRINEQDEKRELLEQELEGQQQIVEQKVFLLDQMWEEAHTSFLVHIPESVRVGAVRKEEEYEVIEPHVSSKMITDLADKIVEKVQE
jgi:F0F1-type ATP synthase membrane subunit b/b'